MNYLNSLLVSLVISLSCISNAQEVDDTNKTVVEKWFRKNINKLYWDVETHSVNVN